MDLRSYLIVVSGLVARIGVGGIVERIGLYLFYILHSFEYAPLNQAGDKPVSQLLVKAF